MRRGFMVVAGCVVVATAFAGCGSQSTTKGDSATSTATGSSTGSGTGTGTGVAGGNDVKLPAGTTASAAKVKSARYDAKQHAIIATLEYGGCGATKHAMTLGICLESYPAQCTATLHHPSDFNSTCDMLVTEDATFVLAASFDGAYVTLESKTGKATPVLVDRDGKVAAMQKKP